GDSGGEGNSGVLLLPATEVVKATARGKEMAAKNPPKEEEKSEKKDEDKGAKGDSGKKAEEPKKPGRGGLGRDDAE
ncbi:MAG TPA: hypothetical protein VHC70_04055, partial [Phycisphaerales bacterium]|nr:hypothetical protein [Phycisphaerales bacterium]